MFRPSHPLITVQQIDWQLPVTSPDNATLFATALGTQRQGRLDEAEQGYRTILAKDAGHADAWHMLSIVRHKKGGVEEAKALIQQALAIREDAEFLATLGNFLQEAQHLAEAETCYRRALVLQPALAHVHYNLGNTLLALSRRAEAETAYRRALSCRPDFAEAYNNLGNLLLEDKRATDAQVIYRQLLALRPTSAEAHYNLANALREDKHFTQAEAMYGQAIKLRPDYADAYKNLAKLLTETGRLSESEAWLRRGLAFCPQQPELQYGLSLALLAKGRYAEAWPLHEARYHSSSNPITKLPPLPYPQWQGEALDGKNLLIWPEQGYGDIVQLARYASLLKERGVACLTFFCTQAMRALLATVPGVDCVVTDIDCLPRQDYWSFTFSLPLHCNTTLDTIPATFPYLHALPERITAWRKRLPEGGLNVGLAWKGNPQHKHDAQRSLPDMALLNPLWRVAGVRFFSLQYGLADSDTAIPKEQQPLDNLGKHIVDFADTAAIIAQLDLIICVDTVIGHIAGAMGKPCWILLPAIHTDWRWLCDRVDSPWYPVATRLFRQTTPGDWTNPITEVENALEQWVAAQTARDS